MKKDTRNIPRKGVPAWLEKYPKITRPQYKRIPMARWIKMDIRKEYRDANKQ